MKYLIFAILFLVSVLSYAQKVSKYATVSLKVVDYLDETVFWDTPFSIYKNVFKPKQSKKIIDSTNSEDMTFCKRLAEGRFQLLLLPEQDYLIHFPVYYIEEDKEDSVLEEQFTFRIEADTSLIIRRIGYPSLCPRVVSFQKNLHGYFSEKKFKDAIVGVEELEGMLSFINDYPLGVKIRAYTTDNEKNPKRLSKLRAKAIQKYFIRNGIARKRLKIEYFGTGNSSVANDSPNNRALNCRVVLIPFPMPYCKF